MKIFILERVLFLQILSLYVPALASPASPKVSHATSSM